METVKDFMDPGGSTGARGVSLGLDLAVGDREVRVDGSKAE